MMRLWSLLMVLVLLLPACRSMPWRKKASEAPPALESLDEEVGYEAPILPEPGLPLSTEQRFPDIPLPADVKEDREPTFIVETATLQVGRMVYTSKATVNELAQFYIKECPAADWTLDRVIQADSTELVFTEPGKRLTVLVRDLGVARGRRLELILIPQTDAESSL